MTFATFIAPSALHHPDNDGVDPSCDGRCEPDGGCAECIAAHAPEPVAQSMGLDARALFLLGLEDELAHDAPARLARWVR